MCRADLVQWKYRRTVQKSGIFGRKFGRQKKHGLQTEGRKFGRHKETRGKARRQDQMDKLKEKKESGEWWAGSAVVEGAFEETEEALFHWEFLSGWEIGRLAPEC